MSTNLDKKNSKFKTMVLLHLLLMLFSVGSIVSKKASSYEFLSWGFILCYGIVLCILVFYAFAWQQILKRLPLVTAYANKAATIVWGIIWGKIFYQEAITVQKIIGALVIVLGVYLVVSEDAVENKEEGGQGNA